ncbi:MAG: protein kinase [Verrucomicrobiales bacterium]|nr:protein kinase [Verrucomicrobiales bacterium]
MKFRCPHCKQKLKGDRSFAGSQMDCPKCNFRFEVPKATLDDDTVAVILPGKPAKTSGTNVEDKYIFHNQIARGGMGKIISATDRKLNRPVVFKKLLDPNEDPVLVKQLIREAQITARLSHPGVVPIHELGHDSEGRIYYTMKHIRGEPLEKVLNQLRQEDPATITRRPFRRLLLIFSRVCDTIAYANENGIVHRDIKPDNIMLAPFGENLVIDWGIAKDLNQKPNEKEDAKIATRFLYETVDGDYGATLHGAVFGSPNYMSPEQARGEIDKIDARSDVFSLGALLFEILTLSPPYDGPTAAETVKHAAERNIKRISDIRKERRNRHNLWPHIESGELPESVLAVALKAMQENPDDRYQTAADLRRDIDAYLTGHTTVAENAGFIKIIKLAINRNKAFAAALAFGLLLTGTTIGFTANLNRVETLKAQAARSEAEEYITKADRTKSKRRETRLEVAPSYVEMARLLANQEKFIDALAVARLAAEYDPDLMDARALVKALEIYNVAHRKTGQVRPDSFPDHPSLNYIANHPDQLNPENGLSEQTLNRLSRAYSEVGLSRYAGLLTTEQTLRIAQFEEKLKNAWIEDDVTWSLTLAPELSSLCHDDTFPERFPDYSKWASGIDFRYPGQILHLEISVGAKLPDLSILSELAIESLSIDANGISNARLFGKIEQCTSLKSLTIRGGQLTQLEFVKNLPLVALRIDNNTQKLDISPLKDCNTLRVLSTGIGSTLTGLENLPENTLQIFSGRSSNGDYRGLAKMPLLYLNITGDGTIDLGELNSLPIQTFISKGAELRNSWNVITSWPLKVLSIDSPTDIDASELPHPLNQLNALYLNGGIWKGPVNKNLPSLELIQQKGGSNIPQFSQIESLRTVQIETDSQTSCYLSTIEAVPPDKELHIPSDTSIHALTPSIAASMISGDWGAAGAASDRLLQRIATTQRLTPASASIKELRDSISKRNDPDELFLSKRRPFQGKTYQAVFCGLDYERAEKLARKVGASLAIAADAEKLAFLTKLASSFNHHEAFWIGNSSSDNHKSAVSSKHGARILERPSNCILPFIIEWEN